METHKVLETKTLITRYQFYLQKHKARTNSKWHFERERADEENRKRDKNTQSLAFCPIIYEGNYGLIEIKLG
jgi:hypothetical protein